jgi:hypothetical protein
MHSLARRPLPAVSNVSVANLPRPIFIACTTPFHEPLVAPTALLHFSHHPHRLRISRCKLPNRPSRAASLFPPRPGLRVLFDAALAYNADGSADATRESAVSAVAAEQTRSPVAVDLLRGYFRGVMAHHFCVRLLTLFIRVPLVFRARALGDHVHPYF